MARPNLIPALCAHGGAGAYGPQAERLERRRGLIEAVRRGAAILSRGGGALDAVVETVAALEDHPLFNAGRGSVLTDTGTVEMDASVMTASSHGGGSRPAAGAVGAVSRVSNPIHVARAVMERTSHLLMVGGGAERFARSCGMRLCRVEDLITERARERWRARKDGRLPAAFAPPALHGTVGAVAVDSRGRLAAATSTGGMPGKLAGRVGDSAIIGAGTYADVLGAASATGQGEAIVRAMLCRELIAALQSASPAAAARNAIVRLIGRAGAEAGVIVVDRRGRFGCAHNAQAMQVAMFDAAGGLRHQVLAPIPTSPRR